MGNRTNRTWQYRCEKCNKVVKAGELNTLTVREVTVAPGQRSLIAMKLCSSCTYKLRNYLYGEDYYRISFNKYSL